MRTGSGKKGLVFAAAMFVLVLCFAAPAPATHVKAVLFDSYGTLVSWEGVEKAVAEVLKKKGSTADPRAFNTFWRTRQLLYIMYNTMVDKGFEPFYFVTRRGLKSAAAFHKVSLTKEEEDQLVAVWNNLDPYPDVIPGLKEIKKLGYIMGPLTNGDREMVRVGIVERFAEMGFRFDLYLTADLFGKNKPHQDIYVKSIAKAGLKPDEVIYVCRGQFDIVGGKAAGLKVMWVNRAKEPLEAHGYIPDWEVTDFFEVAKILAKERP